MSELNLIGTTLGRFEILSELGRGGMAVVYKARQTDLDRVVALKILPPGMTHDASYVARFRQEARSAARLEHPHIMPIYEVGEANGLHYIAMKFIQGRTLKDLAEHEGALPVARAAQILAQVGDALDHAHRQGVIHRDIKPSNIMITTEGWAFLTDFGLARGTGSTTGGLTMAGTVMGTPEYMSPEQAQGLPNVGPPTDIYALGVVLYELLTGAFPFKADTPMGMLAARLLQAPIPPRDVRGDLPSPVEDVVMRALARKPEARFASAAEMVAALRAAAGIGAAASAQRPVTPQAGLPALGETIKAPIPTPPPPIPPPTPPYVRPPTPPPAQYAATAQVPQPTAPPNAWSSTLPGGVPPAPPAPAKRGLPMPLILGGVGALLLLLVIVGAVVALTRPGPEPLPPTAVASDNPRVAELLAAGDAALTEPEGMDAAIDSYTQARSLAPDDPRVLRALALAANLRANWPRAEEQSQALIDAAGADPALAALAYALHADAIASQGDPLAAEESVSSALERDPDLALAYAIRSNIRAGQARDTSDRSLMDQALQDLDQAVDSLADEEPLMQALVHNALGYTFYVEYAIGGDETFLAQSEESYKQAIDLQPNLALFHAQLGYLYSSQDRYDDARTTFEEALALDPGLASAQAAIGWTYYYESESERALKAFDQAIVIDPDDYYAYFGQGRLAINDGDYDTAVTAMTSAAERSPRSPDVQAWLGEALLFRGFNADDDDDREEAYEAAAGAYRAAIAINPNHAFAISGLGWILQYQEEYEDSVAQFQRAIELDDTNKESFNGLGWSLFNLGRYSEAEPHFLRAIELDSDYVSAHYGLGRTYEELGRLDEARAAYEQALAIDPSYSDAQEALDRIQ